jgi:hypothetical protein
MTVADYLKRYPSARSSTLAYLEKRQQTTEQLRREITEAEAGSRYTREEANRFMNNWLSRVMHMLAGRG